MKQNASHDQAVSETHERFMSMALRLARRAQGRTWPNPMVGSVVVVKGRVVGQGYHRRAGTAHAEVLALADAGKKARGADLYVTLEPCHCTGCTGPCTEQIMAAGIRRVFVGTLDPNPQECGCGIEVLRQAGVEVQAAVLEESCRQLNEVYNVFIAQRRPFVVAKAAASLDGRIASHTGDARWISGKAARVYAHRLRARSEAVLVGVGTALTDDPSLDVRHLRGKNPAVVVLDSKLRLSPKAGLLRVDRKAPVWIYCSRQATAGREARLVKAGAQIVRVKTQSGRLSLPAVLADLLAKGVYRLLVEGGSSVLGAFLAARSIDRFDLVMAPCLLGARGKPLADFAGPKTVAKAPRLRDLQWKKLGDDMLCSGRLDVAKT